MPAAGDVSGIAQQRGKVPGPSCSRDARSPPRTAAHASEPRGDRLFSDQKVLNQFVCVSGFLGSDRHRAAPVIKFGSVRDRRREYALGSKRSRTAWLSTFSTAARTRATAKTASLSRRNTTGRPSASAGSRPTPLEWNNKQTQIAYIVSASPMTKRPAGRSRAWRSTTTRSDFKLHVYSTEAGVRREKQQFAQTAMRSPARKRGQHDDRLAQQAEDPSWWRPDRRRHRRRRPRNWPISS